MREGREFAQLGEEDTIQENVGIHNERTERTLVDGRLLYHRRFKQGLEAEERLDMWSAEVSSLIATANNTLRRRLRLYHESW